MSIVSFISTLADRFAKENNLSDITYTMCMSSEYFKEMFLKFFFPEVKFEDEVIEREWAEGDCRPDFYIRNNGITYLVECKIWDRNHHFEQYVKRFGILPAQLGYITNYKMFKKGFIVKTWTEFYNYLLDKSAPKDDKDLIDGYCEYLSKVCSINNITSKMTLEGMNSLYTFYNSLSGIVSANTGTFESSEYDSRRDTNSGGNVFGTPRDGVMGKYFELNIKGRQFRCAWGWMGVYFNQEKPIICIGFDNRTEWGKPIYNKIVPHIDSYPAGKTHTAPYTEENNTIDAVWFDFTNDEVFEKAAQDEQIEILREFFLEVIESIIKQSKIK